MGKEYQGVDRPACLWLCQMSCRPCHVWRSVCLYVWEDAGAVSLRANCRGDDETPRWSRLIPYKFSDFRVSIKKSNFHVLKKFSTKKLKNTFCPIEIGEFLKNEIFIRRKFRLSNIFCCNSLQRYIYTNINLCHSFRILSDLAFLHELKTLHWNTNDANTHFIG